LRFVHSTLRSVLFNGDRNFCLLPKWFLLCWRNQRPEDVLYLQCRVIYPHQLHQLC